MPLLPLWAFVACSTVHFTITFPRWHKYEYMWFYSNRFLDLTIHSSLLTFYSPFGWPPRSLNLNAHACPLLYVSVPEVRRADAGSSRLHLLHLGEEQQLQPSASTLLLFQWVTRTESFPILWCDAQCNSAHPPVCPYTRIEQLDVF
jgi:hypothetical protein